MDGFFFVCGKVGRKSGRLDESEAGRRRNEKFIEKSSRDRDRDSREEVDIGIFVREISRTFIPSSPYPHNLLGY